MRERKRGTNRDRDRETKKGACGVMAIVVGNPHDDKSSNPRRVCLHFKLYQFPWKKCASKYYPDT